MIDHLTCYACRKKWGDEIDPRPFQNVALTHAGIENVLCQSCAAFLANGQQRLVNLILAVMENSASAFDPIVLAARAVRAHYGPSDSLSDAVSDAERDLIEQVDRMFAERLG